MATKPKPTAGITITGELLCKLVDAATYRFFALGQELDQLDNLADPDNQSSEWTTCRIDYEDVHDTITAAKTLLLEALDEYGPVDGQGGAA